MLIDMPVKSEEFQKGPEYLLSFYETLGWNPNTHLVDPAKIRLSSKDTSDCLNHFMSSATTNEEKAGLGMTWVNLGPSHSDSVPEGKVELLDGWIEEDK